MPRLHRLALKRVFDGSQIRTVFTQHVWPALRAQPCKDLLFFYDYRRDIEARAEQLSAVVTLGNYRPKASLPIAVSRPDLLARNMHIPHPDDALIMQVISEALLPFVQRRAPSRNAHFARSHSEFSGLHTQGQLRLYPWFRLWPRYQMKVLNFAKVRSYLVVTDIQSFFDSVDFSHIRFTITREIHKSGPLLDLLLLLFENFIRRDMYKPVTLQGIPTLSLDAPRLIGHALLFEVDRHLKKATGKSFARWMDDINFGVDSVKDARDTIRAIDSLLRRVGLRLGGGKTKVLSYDAARRYLQADENQVLNVIDTQIKDAASTIPATIVRKVFRGFVKFRATEQHGYWDKVMRRYYGLVGRVLPRFSMSPYLKTRLRRIEMISRRDFDEMTSTQYRGAIIRFWSGLRPTDARVSYYLKCLLDVQNYDDETAFALAEMLVQLPLTNKQSQMVMQAISQLPRIPGHPGFFYGMAWCLAKYGSQREILEFATKSEKLWEANYFFARQVVALWSLLPCDLPAADRLRERFLLKHDPEIANTIAFIEKLRATKTMDPSLKGTLPINLSVKHVDLTRAILSSNVMRSPNLHSAQRAANSERISDIVADRRLRELAIGGFARIAAS